MAQEPYACADRVFWVVDNGSSHRGAKAIDRLAEQSPTTVLVHTPVHASWLKRVEVYFFIIQRKALSPNDFTDLDAVEQRSCRLRGPLQHGRQTLELEAHHQRSRRPPGKTRPTPRSPDPKRRPTGSSLIPDELTNLTTKAPADA
jgi:hypothetical protein